MSPVLTDEPDLTPSAFEEGLALWSEGDGTPDAATYDTLPHARIARNDVDFGTCLELRKTEAVVRLRYTGEMPVRPGAWIEVSARLRALRGPLPEVRVAAWTGGAGGRAVTGQPCEGPLAPIASHGAVEVVRAVIAPEAAPGVDLVWGPEVLYAHVGLDLTGAVGGVVRIESVEARDVTRAMTGSGRVMPGFTAADAT